MEIRNKLTVARGEVGRNNGGKGEWSSRNVYKGHRTKPKGDRIIGLRMGGEDGWSRGGGWWKENGDYCT